MGVVATTQKSADLTDPAAQAADVALAATVNAQATVAATPAALAQVIAQHPQFIEAIIVAAQKSHGNGFVQSALGIVENQAPAEAPASAHHADAPAPAQADVASKTKQLTDKWGVRPHRFGGYVDGSNAAEMVFRETVPTAVAFINQRAKANHHEFQISNAELTTNFIAEGGNSLLDNNALDGIDGFNSLGLDTFMDRIDSLKPWLHPSIEHGRVIASEHMNEKQERVHSVGQLTLVQAIYASAAMLALTKSMLERDAKGTTTPLGKMNDTEQFYLETIYYNAGPGVGKGVLDKDGPQAAHRKWTGTDDTTHNRNAQYNASWRTSTYELMRDSTLDRDQFRPAPADAAKAGNDDLGQQIERIKVTVADLDEFITRSQAEITNYQLLRSPQETIDSVQKGLDEATKLRAAKVEMLAELVQIHKPDAAAGGTSSPTP